MPRKPKPTPRTSVRRPRPAAARPTPAPQPVGGRFHKVLPGRPVSLPRGVQPQPRTRGTSPVGSALRNYFKRLLPVSTTRDARPPKRK